MVVVEDDGPEHAHDSGPPSADRPWGNFPQPLYDDLTFIRPDMITTPCNLLIHIGEIIGQNFGAVVWFYYIHRTVDVNIDGSFFCSGEIFEVAGGG